MLQGSPGTPFHTFRQLKFGEWHVKCDEENHLIAIIAIHNTFRGPALGGCRFLPYSSFEDALIDASRLAEGMSLKAAISDIPFGGGKSVIIKPNKPFDRIRLFNAFGKFIQDLNGRYITAEDSGTQVADMDAISHQTSFVTGSSKHAFAHKDPSPLTAMGVRRAIEAAVKFHLKRDSLEGIHIAIQGVGNVGYHLAKECFKMGAKLTLADINEDKLKQAAEEFRADTVATDNIQSVPCDIFAPCALSNAITKQNIQSIQCKIIAGAANNQLADESLSLDLAQAGILYLPDFMINAGGLIHVAAQYEQAEEQATRNKVSAIYDTSMDIMQQAQQTNCTPLAKALSIAKSKLNI